MLLSSAGQSVRFSHLYIDYSLGEMVVSTEQNNKMLISQGFHQYFVIPDIDAPETNRHITLSPVPAQNLVNLRRFGNNIPGARYTIYDVRGQIMRSARMTGNPTEIDISSFSEGLYIIRVTDLERRLIGIKKFTKN